MGVKGFICKHVTGSVKYFYLKTSKKLFLNQVYTAATETEKHIRTHSHTQMYFMQIHTHQPIK